MADLQARLQSALGDAYHIEKELGGGGMSRVFLATEASLHRQVVIKLLPPELASEVSEARFRQEIGLAAHLQHTNILPVLTAGARDDLLFYVMPFVTGESLRHRMTREGKLPVTDAVRVLHEIADALAYAHAEGVIHRDVKPENILLLGSHAVLTDFGVARALAGTQSGGRLTDTGVAIGTPAYMSPEQAAGEPQIDARADVYALAVVGYEMLAGFPPFAGRTAQSVIAAHFTQTPKPLADLQPLSPPEVVNAIMQALAKDPGARLHTAAEFRDALGGGYARPGPRRLSRRARLAAVATVFAVIGVGAVLILRPSAPSALDPDLLAVAPFDVLAPHLDLWREGLVDILSRNLDGAGSLRTVSPTVVVRRWSGRADPTSAQELARRTGAGLVVFGALVGAGPDSVRLTATVFDARVGATLAELEIPGSAERMDRISDSLTIATITELGRTRPIGGARLTSLGSRSLPAIKAFLKSEQFYRRAQWDSSLAYARRAVATDSGFTLALRRISLSLWWGDNPSVTPDLLLEGAHNRGLAPRDSLLVTADSLWGALLRTEPTPPYALRRRLYLMLQDATRRYPDDPEVWYHLGEAGYHHAYSDDAIPMTAEQTLATFERAIALDSAFAPAYQHAIELALTLRAPPVARRYIAAMLALNPRPSTATSFRLVDRLLDPAAANTQDVTRFLDTVSGDGLFNAWFALKNWDDSAETALRVARLFAMSRAGFQLRDSSGLGWRIPAAELAVRGHLREAYGELVAGNQVTSVDPFWWRIYFAELARFGAVPPDSAAAAFARWLPSNEGWGLLGLGWWANRGDTGSIQKLAQHADSEARAVPTPIQGDFWRYVAASTGPYLALARGDTAAALRRFASLPDSLCSACYLERLTWVQLLERRPDDRKARVFLERELEQLGWVFPSRVLWVLERGRVNERLGNKEKAIVAFRYVTDVWRHADPELQPYVEEAKAALKRLAAEPR